MSSILEIPRPVAYRFHKFELLPDSEELRKRGTRIHLPPQPFRVLLLLVSRAGEVVPRETIQRELWSSETFVDFEQGINSAIRRIRFALHDDAETPRFLQTIPRRGYSFIAPVERIEAEWVMQPLEPMLPPAPEPPPLRTVDAFASEDHSPLVVPEERPSRALRLRVLAAAMLVLFATRAPQSASEAKIDAAPLRIAVSAVRADAVRKTPFDPRRIGDELHAHLARLQPQRIRIAERGAPADLRVDAWLQDAGGVVRLNARVIETKSGKQVWAETMNRNAAHASDFPQEVALRVTQAVSSRYLLPGREEPLLRTRVSPATLALYREARAMRAAVPGQRDTDGALRLFQQAVTREPHFAEAWSGIGDVWIDRMLDRRDGREEAFRQARAALERALALDPQCVEALNDYAVLLMQQDRKYAEAEGWLRRAIAADRDYVHSYVNLAVLQTVLGKGDLAVVTYRRAQALDPNQLVPSVHLAFLYMTGRRYDDSAAEYHSAQLMARGATLPHWGKMWAAMLTQRWEEAARELSIVLEQPVVLEQASAASFRRELRRLEPKLVERERAGLVDPYILACFYALRHENDLALAALDRAIEQHSWPAIYARVDPRLDWLRDDPRFESRLVRLGFRR